MKESNTDIRKLWSLSPEDFNAWRMENDLPRLFAFFQKKLPLFNDWLEEFGIDEEQFLSAPNTGMWFAGSEKLRFEEFIENKNRRFGIFAEKNIRKESDILKRFPGIEFETVKSISFLPYL